MNKTLTWKIGLILLVIAVSVYQFIPKVNEKTGEKRDAINLGLDLKGGMHLILEVDTEKAIQIQSDQEAEQLKSSLKKEGINVKEVVRVKDYSDRIEIRGINSEEEDDVTGVLKNFSSEWNYEYYAGADENTSKCILTLPVIKKKNREDDLVNQAIETIRNRVDKFGVSEAVIQRSTEFLGGKTKRIVVQLPGEVDKRRAKKLIKSTAMLEFKHVLAGPFGKEKAMNYKSPDNEDFVVVPTNKKYMSSRAVQYYILKKASVVTGNELKNSRPSRDQNGRPAIGFSFKTSGANKFEAYTSDHIDERLSIVLDNEIVSVATINDTISYEGIITGTFSPDDVKDMVLVLRSGALPAPMKILQERIIGPSLGADSIKKGFMAAIVGLVLVMIFMLVYYKMAGINSVFALLLNMIILLGILATVRATLTLPGIAGIILTIGMAVDANVLVFERIKEDIRSGKSPKAAIDSGFKKAFVTVFDANLTTVIAAIFLYQFGTGPIKGFSVTLIIGVIASMFTAIFVSRVIFDLIYGKKKKLDKLSI